MMKTIPLAPVAPPALEQAYQALLARLPAKRARKIVFINIPQVPADIFSPETARLNGYHIYPPVGYLYLCAAARQADPTIELRVLDLNYEMLKRCHQGLIDVSPLDFWKPLIEAELADGSTTHVCVGNMFEATSQIYLDVAQFVRRTFPNVTVLSGGVQVTLDYKEVLARDCAHLVLRHESEYEFRRFLESSAAEEPSGSLPAGMAFMVDGALYETEPRAGVTEFLDIREYYDLIDIENYYQYGGVNPYSRYVGKGEPFGTVLANRGCRAHCTFCGVESFNGVGVRRRSARSIVDEIKYLRDEKGVKLIEWLDDDLVYGRPQSVELFKLMAEELPGLQWIANNGVIGSAVSEDVMYWMVQSGCQAFKVGIESGNEDMLKTIKKPASKASLRKSDGIFKKYPDVFVSGNFIVGFPGETVAQMLDSFEFANELSWDWANYYICQPLPGTDLFTAFQSLGDDRCKEDQFRVYNPGKSSVQKGNFGYFKGYHTDDDQARSIKSGRDVFNLPKDLVPTAEQVKEIWFTFNLVTNFINNRNFTSEGKPWKIVKWFESIAASYPRDAAMSAMLAYGHELMGNSARARELRDKFHRLVDEHDYWKRRVEEFPELPMFADAIGVPVTEILAAAGSGAVSEVRP